MEPEIVELEAFSILGLQERFTPDNEDFEGIWNRFMVYHDQVNPHSVDGAYYGASFAGEEGASIVYVVGVAVDPELKQVPEGLTLRRVPASRYAVFICTVQTISETYDRIFGEWMTTAPYPRPGEDSPKADFERYPPGTDTGESPVLIYIALEEREEEGEGA